MEPGPRNSSENPFFEQESVVVEFHKLVRNRYNKRGNKQWSEPVIHTADTVEYGQKLMEKFREELDEIRNAKTKKELRDEFADFLEVFHAEADFYGFDIKQVQAMQTLPSTKPRRFEDKQVQAAVIFEGLEERINGIQEAQGDRKKLKEELAGLFAQIGEVFEFYGFSFPQIEAIRQGFHTKFGGFSKRIILDSAKNV